ncbi:MAG: hypothetical protein Q9165_007873 [Trypethelium subeluteriae]
MSSRVTRSSARLSAGSSNNSPGQASSTAPAPPQFSTSSRKRKAVREPSPDIPTQPDASQSSKQSKRPKASDIAPPSIQDPPDSARSLRRTGRGPAAMSSAGTPSDPTQNTSSSASTSTSKRKGSRKKTGNQGNQEPHSTPSGPSQPSRKTKRLANKNDSSIEMENAGQETGGPSEAAASEPAGHADESDHSDDEGHARSYDQDEQDVFGSHFLTRHGGPGNLAGALRAMSGFMPGVSGRLRDIMNRLKDQDSSLKLIALQELSELLLVSTEDNLQGHFSPDQCVKELVTLMQPSKFGEENPDMMLLACRCLANLMEALPTSTANVVYGGAVPVLCQKLVEINYIDVAEQALSTLEKISVEFPSFIVREGGLTGCLEHLDFFPTGTQRTAVTTAANCCRKIPEDSFPVVRDVMPTLLNVLNSSDQKVVEKASLCVSGIVDSFGHKNEKLEKLVSKALLKAILRLLLPGTTNLIGPNIHTQFLRVLSTTAKASPRSSVELLKMDIVDTLYQILTGVSPPTGTDDAALKIDKNVIMQALVHRPREQVFETLNVICELLPSVERNGLMFVDDLFDAGYPGNEPPSLAARITDPRNETRISLLKTCKEQLKRFAVILMPTLTEAYSSTVNLSVRQKVLTAQLKMLSNLDSTILEDALRVVPYASYLASILSQEDHPSLVTYALQATELLLKRLEPIYRYQFYREGVISEISRLASRPLSVPEEKATTTKLCVRTKAPVSPNRESFSSTEQADGGEYDNEEMNDDDQSDGEEEDEEGDEDHDDEDQDDGQDDVSASSGSSNSSERPRAVPSPLSNVQDIITLRAKRFIDVHEIDAEKGLKQRASSLLSDMQALAENIRTCYLGSSATNGKELFILLADYFDGDALQSITSYELLSSGIVQALLDVFAAPKTSAGISAQSTFLEVFMGPGTTSTAPTTIGGATNTPFSSLVQKLQDLLSRAEHFEVITVHQNSLDSNRTSAASMLAKQLKLKLVADGQSGFHKTYENIMVSIHAIATFKALDEYLRPRLRSIENPNRTNSRDRVTSAIAAYAAAMGVERPRPRIPGGVPPPPMPSLPLASSSNRPPPRKSSKTGKPSAAPSGEGRNISESALERPYGLRRSTRKHGALHGSLHGSLPQTPPPPPPSNPPVTEETMQEPLECADETHFSDDEDDDEALDAVMEDLEEELDDDVPDPSAINMEVTDEGGKVTARQEDGTRVPTPSQASQGSSASALPTAVQRPQATTLPAVTTPSSSRPLSYAAAIQAVPQDWHIEFSINDRPISHDTTIYRAVHFNGGHTDDAITRAVWSNLHTIKFKRVSGPPPTESSAVNPPPETYDTESGLPHSLDKNPTTSAILRLLSILHELNANMDDVFVDSRATPELKPEPLSQFVNTKLTAKLNRQLEEPLIVASNCLPIWSEDLARLYPFLFPFETRHLFLQSTSFGYSRSMTRWQNAQSTSDARPDRHRDERPFLGRLQRQKVRIARTRIFESAVKVMELYGASPSILEVEYFEEVGTGLGPTLEFYSSASKEFSTKKIKLWRENESNNSDEFAFGKHGLFPAPMSAEQAEEDNGKRVIHLFKMLGKFVARSMLDSRIIDVSFHPTFFRVGEGLIPVSPSLGAVASVDEHLANSLKMLKQFATLKQQIDENTSLSPAQKVQIIGRIEVAGSRVEDMGLDFTLPGYPSIELCENGSETPVTIDNVDTYVDRVIDFTLGSGVKRQVEAFRTGFSSVFPYTALRAFTPDELVMLFGRAEEDWSLETLLDSVKADHGYNLDSRSVRNLLQTMSELAPPARRDFLQFITGSPKLPIGGFKALTPMFTVVCKPSEPPHVPDDYLPSVMTCVNYLKMPDYSTPQMLRDRLGVAIKEGQGAFHLS